MIKLKSELVGELKQTVQLNMAGFLPSLLETHIEPNNTIRENSLTLNVLRLAYSVFSYLLLRLLLEECQLPWSPGICTRSIPSALSSSTEGQEIAQPVLIM